MNNLYLPIGIITFMLLICVVIASEPSYAAIRADDVVMFTAGG